MITRIAMKDVASYSAETQYLENLSKLVFIFGSNGTGKTTISKLISNESEFETCDVQWKNNIKLETIVFNQDFIKNNFDQSSKIDGIFSLGDKAKEAKDKIDIISNDIDTLEEKVSSLTIAIIGDNDTLGKQAELDNLAENFRKKCWRYKNKYYDIFKDAFVGSMGSMRDFANRILAEYKNNDSSLEELTELSDQANILFGEKPELKEKVNNIDNYELEKLETAKILTTIIVGRSDVDIAELIDALGNSDWVKKGIEYYNNNICPFCQQYVSDSFQQSLNLYFDQSYSENMSLISNLVSDYESETNILLNRLDQLNNNQESLLDHDTIRSQIQIIESEIQTNKHLLNQKMKEPSRKIELKSLSKQLEIINRIVDNTNISIDNHNKLVNNLARKRKELTGKVWKYLIAVDLESDILVYLENRTNIMKAINGMREKIQTYNESLKTKRIEIKKLEALTTSVKPTIDAINRILNSYGFTNFKLAPTKDEKDYKLVREDGRDAKESLSEGEKNFVVFLYFYYLLQGSKSEDGLNSKRIAVFDDPVSSLDCDVLFVVSSLIRKIIDDVNKNIGIIKQVFVLTHNVYFHKEVTFRKDIKNRYNNESYWIIKKEDGYSKFVYHESNPIKTSYELLWSEIKNKEKKVGVQNTMRRILEYYYRIIGNMKFNDLIDKFEGEQKIICNSLFSWMHAGSHLAFEDAYFSDEAITVEAYYQVFREIFEKSHHGAHYTMMMEGSEQNGHS